MRLVSLALLVLTVAACQAQRRTTPADIPAGWLPSAPPQPETEAASCANWARDSWTVALSPDSTMLQIRPGESRYVDTATVRSGRLTSENRGEFGGDVWWEPTNGRRQRIAQINLVAFAPTRAALMGLAGLAHLSINEGRLVRFDQASNGDWSVRTVLDLGAAPEAFTTLADDTLLVVTSGALLTVRAPSHVKAIYRNAVWPYTYATSVVRDRAGIVYVGMRSTVARLSPAPSGLQEEWLVRAECPARKKTSDFGECSCVQTKH